MRSATFASVMFLAATSPLSAQAPTVATEYAAKGLAAADTFPGYASLCNLEARIRNVNTPRDGTTGGGQRNSGADAHDHSGEGDLVSEVPPTQVFDNHYFLGTAEVNTWLYGTEAMGGVINIITKPVSPTWTGSVTIEGVVPEHDEDSAERQIS